MFILVSLTECQGNQYAYTQNSVPGSPSCVLEEVPTPSAQCTGAWCLLTAWNKLNAPQGEHVVFTDLSSYLIHQSRDLAAHKRNQCQLTENQRDELEG